MRKTKPSEDFSKKATKQKRVVISSEEIDTVAVIAMSLIPKSEYDGNGVKDILPLSVVTKEGEILRIPPVVVVGPSGAVLNKVMNNFQKMWASYNKLVETELKRLRGHDGN